MRPLCGARTIQHAPALLPSSLRPLPPEIERDVRMPCRAIGPRAVATICER